jgi:hypothetical protein
VIVSGSHTREDAVVVAGQLGREPRGFWEVWARCPHGRPTVISTAPVLEDGSPFPTLYWLTCPALAAFASTEESAGQTAVWTRRLAQEPALAGRMRAADTEYRRRRQAYAGADPVPGVGIAGKSDPLAVKCLHAHAAAFLAGLDDPVGEAVVGASGFECDDDACSPRREGSE